MSVRLVFVLVATLAAVGVFFNGRRFARMAINPWAGKSVLGHRVEGAEMTIDQVRRLGRIQMVGAPVIWAFLMAVGYFSDFQK